MSTRFFSAAALIGIFAIAALGGGSARADAPSRKADVERGRYIVTTGGCHDCHTPMFGAKRGHVPESDWLIGDGVGWKGPWGTTYPSNLRALAASMKEEEWVRFAKALKTRPPMPAYALNAMTEPDLKAVYQFLKSLGASTNKVPAGLPPGETPTTPYLDLNLVLPAKP